MREIREFFYQRGVLEVETPLLSRAANPDPAIESVECRVTQDRAWLRTSPEFPLKRLVAASPEPVYELGRVFRDGEVGRLHNPEFTMLEWYRPGMDDLELAQEVVDLVHALQEACGESIGEVRTLTFDEALTIAVPELELSSSLETFRRCFRENGWPSDVADRREAFEIVMACGLDAVTAQCEIVVLTDFPSESAALAKSGIRRPETSSRFEVYFHGMELANGYHELQDAEELEKRFAMDLTRRSDALPSGRSVH